MPRAEFFSPFGIFVRREFLDAPLCAQLRQAMDAAPAHASLVAEQAADAVDQSYRSTVTAEVPDATKSLVRTRLEKLRPDLERHFDTALSGLQPAQFLRYREGDYFRAHADHEDTGPDHVTERRVSAVLFLNGESDEPEPGSYAGGALTFFGLMGDPRVDTAGFPLVGEPGLLVAFPSDLVHSVTPVTRGERYTVVSWFT
jgi:SM-20-related protein